MLPLRTTRRRYNGRKEPATAPAVETLYAIPRGFTGAPPSVAAQYKKYSK